MTFSEYIKLYSYDAYLAYCKQKELTPQIDVKINVEKLCALVKPKLDPNAQK